MNPPVEPDPADSLLLRQQFGQYWRAWRWLRAQFSATSLTTIVTILAVSGGWINHLNGRVSIITERVVVLETQVVPILHTTVQEVADHATLQEHEDRLNRLETNWDEAEHQAGREPRPRRVR